MPITKDNFIVVYRIDNSDSRELAEYYADKHDMLYGDPLYMENVSPSITAWEVDGQLVGINCSGIEILEGEVLFEEEVLNPLREALDGRILRNREILGIVLGYNIPGGFVSEENLDPSVDPSAIVASVPDIISSTSRVSRGCAKNISGLSEPSAASYYGFGKKRKNKLYDRSVFSRFDRDDANHLLIVSRIDAPTLLLAKQYIDQAEILNKQLFANGIFYIDPYSDKSTTGAGAYKDSIEDFYSNLFPSLNLDSWVTTFMDPYIDVAIPYVENDSFVWSWFTDRATSSFFQDSNAIRIFFYNADFDGAYTIRNINGIRWPYLAMTAGYVVSAGAMSDPTMSGFLNPTAFFNALVRGATLGEAYYFSLPFLDWTMTLFGDPLIYCSFPASGTQAVGDLGDLSIAETTNQHEAWNQMAKNLSKAAVNLYKKEIELKEFLYEIIDITSTDFYQDGSQIIEDGAGFVVAILSSANDLYQNNNIEAWQSQLKPLVDKFFDFPRSRYFYYGDTTIAPNINEYLSNHDFKISRVLSLISGESIINEDNLLDEGWWQFEYVLQDDDPNNFVNYHFVLEVATNSSFSNIIITKDSYSIKNWTYEKEKDIFVNITSNGVTSSYIGRKIRYESRQDALIGLDEYLVRGQVYYFRITQYNLETDERYQIREYSEIVYS